MEPAQLAFYSFRWTDHVPSMEFRQNQPQPDTGISKQFSSGGISRIALPKTHEIIDLHKLVLI